MLFEFIIFAFRKTQKLVLYSIARLVPFVAVFYYFFIYGGDSRTGLIKYIVSSFFTHKFYITYGFFASLSNIIFQDSITARFFDWQASFIKFTSIGLPYVFLLTIFISILGIYLLFKNKKNSKKITIIFSLIIILWSIFSNSIFNTPVINLNETTNYVAYLGGIILVYLFAVIFAIEGKARRKYIFLLLSFFLSLAAYWAYEPLISLNTTHRYLTGTFTILVGLLAFIYINANKKVKVIIIIWGLLNLIGSFIFQNQILNNRAFPVDSFYRQLKIHVPIIRKGDVFYFDFGNDTDRNSFQNAISTASMPNETAFAWRYKVDRYDLKIINSFNNFIEIFKNKKASTTKFHSFYYSGGELIDTTNEMNGLLEKGSSIQKLDFTEIAKNDNLTIDLKTPLVSLTPSVLNLTISANPPDLSKINFPYIKDSSFSGNSIAINSEKRDEAFKYQIAKNILMKNIKITSSSDWMTDVVQNAIDGDKQTNWRANRLLWGKEKTNLVLDLGKITSIGEFVWVNGFGNSTPTKYSIDISIDGKNWENVSSITKNKRIDSKDPQVINFNPEDIRYIRMNFDETLDGDSPQISEVWVVPTEFEDLILKETGEFLNNPFGYVPDNQSFLSTLYNLNYAGAISINGINNKIIYDGIVRTYSFTIPASGTTISELVLKNLQIPGSLILKNISYKNMSLKEIESK